MIAEGLQVDDSKRGEVPELENVLVENHSAAPKTLQKSSKKESNAKSSPEDENTEPQTKTKKGKSKRPPVTSKKTRVQSVLGQTGRKSTRKNLVTPARSMLDSSMMMGATPLITPRFDPRESTVLKGHQEGTPPNPDRNPDPLTVEEAEPRP
ncbi:unnamed protein product [Boreogadus saida]